MGLFDKFLKKTTTEFTYTPSGEAEAWVGILLACMTADGDMDEMEINALARMLAMKKKFSGVEISKYFAPVMQAKNELGGLGLVDACAKLIPADEKNTVFTLAVELVLADGSLDDGEVQVIEALANAMEMDKADVEKIIQVMLIRNKGNYMFA